MIANSHVLSLIMSIVFILFYELIQFFKKNIHFYVIKNYFHATAIFIIIGSYSLFNIADVYIKSNVMTPGNGLTAINPALFITSLLQNNLNEEPAWNYGLPVFILQLFLTLMAFKSKGEKSWKPWIYGADILTISMFDWWPWQRLIHIFVSIIQLLGRLEGWIVLLVAVASTIYFSKRSEQTVKKKVIIIELFIILVALAGSYHTNHTYVGFNNHEKVYAKGYLKFIAHKPSVADYLPQSPAIGRIGNELPDKYKVINTSVDSIVYSVYNASDKMVAVPVVMYDGFKYRVELDGKAVQSHSKTIVEFYVKSGYHEVRLESLNSRHIGFFALSIIGILIAIIKILSSDLKFMFMRIKNVL